MDLPYQVKQAIRRIMDFGGQAYVVGGALRDLIMNRPVTDYDIATSFEPGRVEEIFADCRTYSAGKRFGTITVIYDELPMEITTFRGEGTYSDSRHPDEVLFISDIEADLARRDFTINAMAYNPFTDSGILDPFNGLRDLRNGIIRTVGAPEVRFGEDPLRMMRGIRFASVLGFTLSEDTYKAISEKHGLLDKVSSERIHDELIKILLSPYPDKGLKLLQDTSILSMLFNTAPCTTDALDKADTADIADITGKMDTADTDGSIRPHALPDTAQTLHKCCSGDVLLNIQLTPEQLVIIKECSEFQPNLVYRLSTLLYCLYPDYSEAEENRIRELLRKLRFDNACINHTVKMLSGYSLFSSSDTTPYDVRKLLGLMGQDDMRQILRLYETFAKVYKDDTLMDRYKTASCLLENILNSKDPVYMSELAITGDDILRAGIGRDDGKIVGEAIKTAYDMILNDPALNDKHVLLKKLSDKFPK